MYTTVSAIKKLALEAYCHMRDPNSLPPEAYQYLISISPESECHPNFAMSATNNDTAMYASVRDDRPIVEQIYEYYLCLTNNRKHKESTLIVDKVYADYGLAGLKALWRNNCKTSDDVVKQFKAVGSNLKILFKEMGLS